MTTTVLCTSTGNFGFQAIYAALKAAPEPISVLAVDADPHAYGIYLADQGYLVPGRDQAEALLAAVVAICQRENVDLLMPLSTRDVAFYAARRAAFEALGVPVAVSPLESVELANDKHRLLEAAQSQGLATPRFRLAANRQELEAALEDFGAERNPVVLKKQFSTGAQGVKVVFPQLDPAERLFSRDNIQISLADLRAWLDGMPELPPLQLSEYLPEIGYSVDVFLQGGQAKQAVVRRENEQLYGMAVVGEILDDPAVEELAVAAAEALGFEYTINVEIGRDAGGTPKLLEINPRFPATMDHTVAAGCNMPYWTVAAALGKLYQIQAPQIGLRYRRYWHSLTVDAWQAPFNLDD